MKVKFKDFVTLQRGFDLPKTHMRVGPFPVVGSSSIIGYHNEFKVEPPGVVTGRSGSLGTVQFINTRYWPHNTSLWVRDFKGNDPRFVFYILQGLDLSRFNAGAGVPTLNRNHLDSLEVEIPTLEDQQKIANVLSAYDDLIGNCDHRVRILEAMAQAVYREWFGDFRYPGGEGQVGLGVLGRIPEGWEATTLGEQLAELESGKRPKGGVRHVEDGVPSIGAENINRVGRHNFIGEKFVPRSFFSTMRKGVVRDRDVAIYKDGAYIGKSSYFRDGFPHAECCVNEHVFLLRSNGRRLKQNALYLWLQEPDTVQAIRATNANAAQPGINQQSVSGLELIVPDEKTADEFDSLVEPLLAGLINCAKQLQNLRRTRDLLLPNLMTGRWT